MPYQKLNNGGRMVAITPSDINNVQNPANQITAVSATGARIVVTGGAVSSVILATPGNAYSNLGTMSMTITGSPGSGATLSPYIDPSTTSGSIGVNVTAGGSLYTDGSYLSGSTYTLNITAGTAAQNAITTQPCQLYVNCTVAGSVKVTTAGGDDVVINISTGSYVLPVQVTKVWSTGGSGTATFFGIW